MDQSTFLQKYKIKTSPHPAISFFIPIHRPNMVMMIAVAGTVRFKS